MGISPNKAVTLSEKEENLIFRLCHLKTSNMLIFLMCVYVHAGVFTHLHVAFGSQKIISGVPSHFPFYLLKQPASLAELGAHKLK